MARFTKGQSGNPGGRPKTHALVVEALRDPERLQDKIAKLEALCAHKSPHVRQRAIETWLAYAIGKPAQRVHVSGGEGDKPVPVVAELLARPAVAEELGRLHAAIAETEG